jgi:putative glutamine amidotransferase
VNSLHHQAVLQLGADLRVSGQAPDGIIEAIEGIHEGRFILGVQWHPEEFDDEQSQAIFGAFIAAARERA